MNVSGCPVCRMTDRGLLGRGVGEAAATEGLVEVDGGLDGLQVVADLAGLRVEEAGLGGQHVQVVDVAADVVLVEGFGGLHGIDERFDLLRKIALLGLCGLQACQSGVDFVAGSDEALLEGDLSFLLLEHGDLLLGAQASVLEDGLKDLSECVPYPFGGVELDGAAVVGEAEGAADGERGEEVGRCAVHGVEGAGQLQFGLLHVGAVLQKCHGHTGLDDGRGMEGLQRRALDVVGCFAEDGAQGVLGLADDIIEVQDAGFDGEAVGLGLCHGGTVGAACLHELLGELHALAPVLGGGAVEGYLGVKGAEGVVEVCDIGHEVLLHGFAHHLGLCHGHLCRLLGVAQAAEAAYLPGGGEGDGVELQRLVPVH